MKRRDFLATLSALTALPVLIANPAIADVNRADLTRITNYLNGISTMQGTFVQIGPDGDLSEGTFYMRRPGRVRFEYNPPNPTLIVADGFWVAVTDTVDNSFDRFPAVRDAAGPVAAGPRRSSRVSGCSVDRAERRSVSRKGGGSGCARSGLHHDGLH